MICLKICTFVVSATTSNIRVNTSISCDLLENLYLCGISNNYQIQNTHTLLLWFAWKFVPLWYQQQLRLSVATIWWRCDLLENLYLCGISNNLILIENFSTCVVICLKICTFVVSATTYNKFKLPSKRCDLLENLYLCGISNNIRLNNIRLLNVVICLKICTFVVSATTV